VPLVQETFDQVQRLRYVIVKDGKLTIEQTDQSFLQASIQSQRPSKK
jgi:hypothetical protein